MSNQKTGGRLVLILVVALCNFGILNSNSTLAAGNSTSTATKDDSQIVGQLLVLGNVTINDKKAINGTSVFTNSRIRVACAKGNAAYVNLGRLGRVELTPGAQLVLRFSNGLISGELVEGSIKVNTPAGVKVAITTQEGVKATDGKDSSVLPVTTQRGVRCVPTVMSSSSSAIGGSALAAMLAGIAGAGVAGAVVAADDDNAASRSVP